MLPHAPLRLATLSLTSLFLQQVAKMFWSVPSLDRATSVAFHDTLRCGRDGGGLSGGYLSAFVCCADVLALNADPCRPYYCSTKTDNHVNMFTVFARDIAGGKIDCSVVQSLICPADKRNVEQSPCAFCSRGVYSFSPVLPYIR